MIANALRTILLATGGVLVGFALIEARLYWEQWRKTGVQRFVWITIIRIAAAVGILFVELEIANRLGNQLSYRLPLALLLFALLAIGLLGILHDDEARQDGEYPRRRATDRE